MKSRKLNDNFFNTRVYFPINIYVHKHKSVKWSEISVIVQIGNSQSMHALGWVEISRLVPVFKSSDPNNIGRYGNLRALNTDEDIKKHHVGHI